MKFKRKIILQGTSKVLRLTKEMVNFLKVDVGDNIVIEDKIVDNKEVLEIRRK